MCQCLLVESIIRNINKHKCASAYTVRVPAHSFYNPTHTGNAPMQLRSESMLHAEAQAATKDTVRDIFFELELSSEWLIYVLSAGHDLTSLTSFKIHVRLPYVCGEQIVLGWLTRVVVFGVFGYNNCAGYL